ncbi:MAG: hypothetical protein ACYDGR_15860 [Candidatus Dormibacteria bacterium]
MLDSQGGAAGLARSSVGSVAKLSADRWHFDIQPETLQWRLTNLAGQLIVEQQGLDLAFGRLLRSWPAGTSGGRGLRTWSHQTIALRPAERLYGLGAQFTRLDKRGTRTVLWNVDTHGSNSSALHYMGVPFLWSNGGWGVVVHTGGRALFEAGWPAHDILTVGAEGGVLDLYLTLLPYPWVLSTSGQRWA